MTDGTSKRTDKELMTRGAERVLRWSFLVPLVCLVVVMAAVLVALLTD